eukprot:m.810300 g.810300  ORF g.810300 m.810300 type:complete len:703 (+) comp23384_c2_seq9:301-2409(+)
MASRSQRGHALSMYGGAGNGNTRTRPSPAKQKRKTGKNKGLNVREEYTAALKSGVAHPLQSMSSKHGSHPNGPPHSMSKNSVPADSVTDFVRSQVFNSAPVDSFADTVGPNVWDEEEEEDIGIAFTGNEFYDSEAYGATEVHGSSTLTSHGGDISRSGYDTTAPPHGTRRRTTKTPVHVLDPDDMAHEIFHLKKHIMAHEHERRLLSTELQRTQREKARLETDVKAIASGVDEGGGKKTALVISLKQVIRDLRGELSQARAQLDAERDSLKQIKVEELNTMCSVYYAETQRLRLLLAGGAASSAQDIGGHGVGVASDAVFVKPSAETMRQLKNENRFLKDEIAKLKTDFSATLDTLHKLRETMTAPPVAAGDNGKYAGVSREDLIDKCTGLENTVALLQAENRGLDAKRHASEKSTEDVLREFGFDSTASAVELRRALEHLQDENTRLRHETEGSEAHRASSIAGGDATPHASVSHNATHATSALGSSTSSVFFSTNNPLEGATATPLAKASPERAAEQHALAALAAQAPAVPDAPMLSSSAAGKEIEEAGVKAALRQRKKFFDAHKDQVDAAITLIQKAVRGHVARRRIHAQRIAKLAPNTANAHASNASELSSASVEQQQSELGSELPTARHASALNSPRTVRKSGITQRNHHEHAHSAPSSRPQSGAVHSHHYEPSEDEDEVVDEVGEAFVDSDHDSLF